MKCRIALFACVLACFSVQAVEISNNLLTALKMAESGCNSTAVGDNGLAVGVLQIHPVYVDDANRILGYKRYNYADRYNVQKSEEMARIVLSHYGKCYERKTGLSCSDEVLARIHNRGYRNWNDSLGASYWERVKSFLN